MAQAKKNTKRKKAASYSADTLAVRLIVGLLLIAFGVLVFMAAVLRMSGDIFSGLRSLCFGLFGLPAFLLPFLFMWGGALLMVSMRQRAPVRPFVLTLLLYWLVCAICNLLTYTGSVAMPLLDHFAVQQYLATDYGSYLKRAFSFSSASSTAGRSGGAVGMLLAWPLWHVGGSIPSAILCILLALVDAAFLVRLDVRAIYARVRQWMDGLRADHAARKQEAEERQRQEQLIWQQQQAVLQQQAQAARMTASQRVQPAPQPVPAPAPMVEPDQPWQQFHPAYSQQLAAQPVSQQQPAVQPVPQQLAPGYGFPPTDDETRPYTDNKPATSPIKRLSRLFGGGGAVPSKPRKAKLFDTPETDVSQQPIHVFGGSTAPQPAPVQAPASYTASQAVPVSGTKSARGSAVQTTSSQPVAHPQRTKAEAPKQQPQPSPDLDDTPPWEDAPAPQPKAPEDVRVPVVPQQTPGDWHKPLDIKQSPAPTYGDRAAAEEQELLSIPYVYPGLDLLKLPEPQSGISPEEDAIRAQKLEETLASFKVQSSVRHITHGPAISRFELELAPGINVNRVTNLGSNIAMNMEVKSVRIEAPIPGKSLVGIEVPNRKVATVTLREVMESDAMMGAKSPLVVALGKDIAGTPIVCNLAKMPHLLIAGQTGSGKSVCINTMINSILYRCSPKEVRLILVDPKVVELQCYNGIPHLLIPVVSDPHKASGALAWAVAEMMDRYKKFRVSGVRNIDGYNAQLAEDEEIMPRIVIIIDELADLMMTCKREVEDHICRLAQLARAAGIHLVVATQRPSVDVITGLIKANIPSRIAFKVSSFVDSRTILDKIGAEQLLGYGDMLYQPTGEFTPIRVQGCFMSDAEVNRVTDFIRENCPSSYDPDIIEQLENLTNESGSSSMPTDVDAESDLTGDGSLLEQAIEMTVRDGQISTSLIQRRFKIGYARAGRLIDEMEARGIVSQKDGAKPRICLISREQYDQMKSENT